MTRRRWIPALVVAMAALSVGGIGACSGDAEGVITVYNAGSLGRPLRAALDTFAARRGVRIEQENAGSLETARKLTELGRIPDVLALADHEVFPSLLMPGHVTWYVQFARNRMVLAFTDRSHRAADIDSTNWWRIVQESGVETGYSDPHVDPAGYRTLLAFDLAELHYGLPGLGRALRDAVPARNVRPKSADLIALLQTGELDYAWEYESVAQAAGLRYVTLPVAVDLSDPAAAATYARAQVRVRGAGVSDSITIRGEPIVYGLSIPTRAARPAIAEQFLVFVLSGEGQRVLRDAKLDALASPVLVGSGAPESIRKLAVTRAVVFDVESGNTARDHGPSGSR